MFRATTRDHAYGDARERATPDRAILVGRFIFTRDAGY